MQLTQAFKAYKEKLFSILLDYDAKRARFFDQTGNVVLKSQDSGDLSVSCHPLISTAMVVVDTEEQVGAAKGQRESFIDVFNTWTRISHGDRGPYPYHPDELDTWTYDEATDVIQCTVNSDSLVGFISPDRHENYVFEVILRSNGSDDDSIGLCLAYTEVDGEEFTIVALRTPGGTQTGMLPAHPDFPVTHNGKLLDVYYDIFHPDHRRDLGSINGGLKRGDGLVYPEDEPFELGKTKPWGNFPEGTRLKVTRAGDQFTVETTDLNSDIYVPSATVSFSLNDYPELAKFKGPQRYGYVCFSQPNSTWETLQRPLVTNVIYNQSTRLIDVYDGSDWERFPAVYLNEYVAGGMFYQNLNRDALYWAEVNGSIVKIPLELT